MPGLFEQFPHTNLHELNLDWLIDMLNQFKEELENSAVLSVNGQTGHVTLYESENVILPALPEGVDQWRLVRLMDGQYVGILFYNDHAYIQRGNETMRLLTLEDIPSSSGVVSWNGLSGVVNVTGADIPVDDTADADSIEQAITNEHVERVNADNALQNSINAINTKLTTVSTVYTFENVGPGAGSRTQVQFQVPAGKTLMMVTVYQTNGLNLVPVWVESVATNSAEIMIWNGRTNATDVSVTVVGLCW